VSITGNGQNTISSGRFTPNGGKNGSDYAGLTMTIVNPESGETHQAPVFCGDLPGQ